MKGTMVDQFRVGQWVEFRTTKGVMKFRETGRITKLHRSGHFGVAEIRPDRPLMATGRMRKIARRLQHVETMKETEGGHH